MGKIISGVYSRSGVAVIIQHERDFPSRGFTVLGEQSQVFTEPPDSVWDVRKQSQGWDEGAGCQDTPFKDTLEVKDLFFTSLARASSFMNMKKEEEMF